MLRKITRFLSLTSLLLFSQTAVGEKMDDLSLTLYYKPTCPFCLKVIAYMDRHHIVTPLEDVSDPEQRQELISIGGKSQVPCLVIDGKPLYESDAIIKWMRENLESQEN